MDRVKLTLTITLTEVARCLKGLFKYATYSNDTYRKLRLTKILKQSYFLYKIDLYSNIYYKNSFKNAIAYITDLINNSAMFRLCSLRKQLIVTLIDCGLLSDFLKFSYFRIFLLSLFNNVKYLL